VHRDPNRWFRVVEKRVRPTSLNGKQETGVILLGLINSMSGQAMA